MGARNFEEMEVLVNPLTFLDYGKNENLRNL